MHGTAGGLLITMHASFLNMTHERTSFTSASESFLLGTSFFSDAFHST